jgi:hypothetical protein
MHADCCNTARSGHLPDQVFSSTGWVLRALMAVCLSLLISCGGGTVPPAAVTGEFGPAGGTLTGPDGVQVVIPQGALNAATTVGIARVAPGAMDLLAAYPAAGSVYEFTPHDLVFNSLVTIKAPVPAGAAGTTWFMASPGGGWKALDAQVTDGIAQWQRASFSFGYTGSGSGCSIPQAMVNDPNWCAQTSGYSGVTATPAQAIKRTSPVTFPNSDPSTYQVDQAGVLHLTTKFSIRGNCSFGSLTITRNNFDAVTQKFSPGLVIASPVPVLTNRAGYIDGVATHNLTVGALDNGKSWFAFKLKYTCPKPEVSGPPTTVTGWSSTLVTETTGDAVVVEFNIPAGATPPAITQVSVGGTVSGLTGTGLVLQNNGADNLPVSANGGFSFPTAINMGSTYAVTVLTSPSGQFCTLSNATGTASANVTNVSLVCSPIVGTSYITGYNNYSNGGPVTVQLNGTDPQTAGADQNFTFRAIPTGSAYNVTVISGPPGKVCTVTNPSGTAPQTRAITVNCAVPPPSLAITSTSPLPSGDVNVPYSVTLSATGGTAPYTWALVGGALPPGFGLNAATGEISGTTTRAAVTWRPIFQATDSASPAASSADTAIDIPIN